MGARPREYFIFSFRLLGLFLALNPREVSGYRCLPSTRIYPLNSRARALLYTAGFVIYRRGEFFIRHCTRESCGNDIFAKFSSICYCRRTHVWKGSEHSCIHKLRHYSTRRILHWTCRKINARIMPRVVAHCGVIFVRCTCYLMHARWPLREIQRKVPRLLEALDQPLRKEIINNFSVVSRGTTNLWLLVVLGTRDVVDRFLVL